MKISAGKKWLMIATATVFDIFGAIPWIGIIFTGIGYFTMYIWFLMSGVSPITVISGKTSGGLNFVVDWIAEFFGFNIYPGLLIATYSIITEANRKELEDVEKISAELKKKRQGEIQRAQARLQNRRS